jgi:hypothetical protein
MSRLGFLFNGIFGLISVVLFLSVIVMWFSAPILLYAMYQKLKSIDEKLGKK